MNVKKITAFTAALALAVSLTACGGDSGSAEGETTTSTAAAETVKDETTTAETTTAAPETTTEETTTTEEVTEPAEEGYQIPDWDNIDYADELDFMTENVEGGVAITEYLGTETVLKIPETIEGKKVVRLGTAEVRDVVGNVNGEGCKNILNVTDVMLPSGFTEINDCAFDGCWKLKSVVIPEGVTRIGNKAFNAANSLESIVIPESVTEIGIRAFLHCEELKSINIPESVTNIGYNAFQGCKSLEELVLPDNVIIDTAGFDYSFWIELNYTTIDLDGCKSLKKFDIPNSVTWVGHNIQGTGDGGFTNCSSFESVTIPNSVTGLGNYAFGSCKNLKSITIPDSVTWISEKAFDSRFDDLEITYGDTTYKVNQLPQLIKKLNG